MWKIDNLYNRNHVFRTCGTIYPDTLNTQALQHHGTGCGVGTGQGFVLAIIGHGNDNRQFRVGGFCCQYRNLFFV